jgi:hypothetical protein
MFFPTFAPTEEADPGIPADIAFVQNYTRGSATSHSQSANIGDAASDREVFVVLVWSVGSSGPAPTLNSMTIGGETATVHVSRRESFAFGANFGIAIASAPVPSGTTATIAFAFSAAATVNRLSTYRAVGIQSMTPVDTASVYSTAQARTAQIDVQAGGVSIVGDVHGGPAVNIAGFTLDQQTQIGAADYRTLCGHIKAEETQANRTLTLTRPTTGSTIGIILAASFR